MGERHFVKSDESLRFFEILGAARNVAQRPRSEVITDADYGKDNFHGRPDVDQTGIDKAYCRPRKPLAKSVFEGLLQQIQALKEITKLKQKMKKLEYESV